MHWATVKQWLPVLTSSQLSPISLRLLVGLPKCTIFLHVCHEILPPAICSSLWQWEVGLAVKYNRHYFRHLLLTVCVICRLKMKLQVLVE